MYQISKTRRAKILLKIKYKVGGLAFPDFKADHKAIELIQCGIGTEMDK